MVSEVICSSHMICYVSDLIYQRDTFPSILFLFSCNFFLIRKTTVQVGRGGVMYLLEGGPKV